MQLMLRRLRPRAPKRDGQSLKPAARLTRASSQL